MIAKKVTFVEGSEAEIGDDNVVLYLQSDQIDDLETGITWGADFTVGNESNDTRNVHIEITANGVTASSRFVLMFWVSSSAAGQPVAIDGIATVGPGRVLHSISGGVGWLETNTAATVTIALNEEDTETIYLNVVMPDATVVSSSGIAFA